jgi:hypothetical protein
MSAFPSLRQAVLRFCYDPDTQNDDRKTETTFDLVATDLNDLTIQNL